MFEVAVAAFLCDIIIIAMKYLAESGKGTTDFTSTLNLDTAVEAAPAHGHSHGSGGHGGKKS